MAQWYELEGEGPFAYVAVSRHRVEIRANGHVVDFGMDAAERIVELLSSHLKDRELGQSLLFELKPGAESWL